MFLLLKIKCVNVSGDSCSESELGTRYAIMFNFNCFRSGRRTWWTRSGCPLPWTAASRPPAVVVPVAEEEAVRQKTAPETRLPARLVGCRPSRRTRSSVWRSCSCPRVRYWRSGWKSWALSYRCLPGTYYHMLLYTSWSPTYSWKEYLHKKWFLKIFIRC